MRWSWFFTKLGLEVRAQSELLGYFAVACLLLLTLLFFESTTQKGPAEYARRGSSCARNDSACELFFAERNRRAEASRPYPIQSPATEPVPAPKMIEPAPEVVAAASDVAEATSDVAAAAPDVAEATPDVAATTPETAPAPSDVAATTPDVAAATPETAAAAPEMTESTPETAAAARNVAASTPARHLTPWSLPSRRPSWLRKL